MALNTAQRRSRKQLIQQTAQVLARGRAKPNYYGPFGGKQRAKGPMRSPVDKGLQEIGTGESINARKHRRRFT